MIRSMLLLPLVLVCVSVAVPTNAVARSRHHHTPPTAAQWYDAPNHTQAVFVGGTYAGADPDPNIRAALAREFGKRR